MAPQKTLKTNLNTIKDKEKENPPPQDPETIKTILKFWSDKTGQPQNPSYGIESQIVMRIDHFGIETIRRAMIKYFNDPYYQDRSKCSLKRFFSEDCEIITRYGAKETSESVLTKIMPGGATMPQIYETDILKLISKDQLHEWSEAGFDRAAFKEIYEGSK